MRDRPADNSRERPDEALALLTQLARDGKVPALCQACNVG
jgi:hypothetical protein